jgi:hypothetical protein
MESFRAFLHLLGSAPAPRADSLSNVQYSPAVADMLDASSTTASDTAKPADMTHWARMAKYCKSHFERVRQQQRRHRCTSTRLLAGLGVVLFLYVLSRFFWGSGPLLHARASPFLDYTSQCFSDQEPFRVMEVLDQYMETHPHDVCLSAPEVGFPHVHIVLRDMADPRVTHHLVNVHLEKWSAYHLARRAYTWDAAKIFAANSLPSNEWRAGVLGHLRNTLHRDAVWIDEPVPEQRDHTWFLNTTEFRQCRRWTAVVARFEVLPPTGQTRSAPVTLTLVDQYAFCVQLYLSVLHRSPQGDDDCLTLAHEEERDI